MRILALVKRVPATGVAPLRRGFPALPSRSAASASSLATVRNTVSGQHLAALPTLSAEG